VKATDRALPAVLATFAGLTDEVAAMPVNMGTAGSYSLGSIADAIVFDYTCHTRWDVLAPRGPIQRALPDLDGGRLTAATRWLIGGIPQMTTIVSASCSLPVRPRPGPLTVG
jgi:hypothetical protein